MGLRAKITAFGNRVSDGMAKWGASWSFLLPFILFLIGWLYEAHAPYLMLNLVLSLLAAIQAPVIMMSQRRKDIKDDERDARERERDLLYDENQLALMESHHALLTDIKETLREKHKDEPEKP